MNDNDHDTTLIPDNKDTPPLAGGERLGAPGGLDHARRGRSSSALMVRDPLQLVGGRRSVLVVWDERGVVIVVVHLHRP